MGTRSVKIELLYFEGCPHYEMFRSRLEALLREREVAEPIETVPIAAAEAAIAHRFLGSPTLRIDGLDVEPSARERNDYGMQCRLYPTREGIRGAPPDDLVIDAISRARVQPI